jgi:predicted phosphodiesterase
VAKTAPAPAYTFDHPHRNVSVVRMDITGGIGWEQWFLLSGDRHHDNPKARQDLELRHLRQAKERGAGIIDVGDLFCAMQGKYDKRADKGSIRPENQSGDYLRSLVKTAADFYEPFAANWIVMGRGNHETAITNRHEYDLTAALVERINDRAKSNILDGGYSGWVRFQFTRDTERFSKRLWYIHGYAGGGQVTKDTIQANRQMVYVANADIMVSGHTHDQWIMPVQRVSLNQSNVVEHQTCHYVKTPSYKDEYTDGHGGWHVETGKPPKPVGAMWLRFWWDGKERGLRTELTMAD